MAKKFLIQLAAVLSMLMILTTAAFADQAERKDDSFDFALVKTVYIEPDIQTADTISIPEIDKLKLTETLSKDKRLLKNLTLTDDKSAADIVITTKIDAWGTQVYWQEPYTYIDYRTISYIGGDGKRYYTSVPVTRYRPGYYYDVQYFSAQFTVTDKTGKVVYERFDRRGDNKHAYAMFGRALRDFYRDFNSLRKDAAKADAK